MVMIGSIYRSGGSKDYVKAMDRFLPAAERGVPRALFYIGHQHYYGCGVPQGYVQAKGWWLSYGMGIPHGSIKAAKWFLKAAENGYAKVQARVGEMYAEGLCVSRNLKKAKEWQSKAAEGGNGVTVEELVI
ncbi:hypothetical protein BGX24_005094 [Mortierella sp. AD032]|nr:hypothetical protein BGX24_005094 [Mortierella sp. AD032]